MSRRNPERPFIIYALADPRTGAVRYVGKSCYGIDRAKEHGRESYLLRWPGPKAEWVREPMAARLAYEIRILEEVSSKLATCDAERRWIAEGRALGWPLTNLTDGGDGVPGAVYKPERSERLRKASKGRARPPFSPEWKAKLLAARKARIGSKMPPKTAETLARMSASHKGIRPSAETRAKMSAARKGKHHNSAEAIDRIVNLNLSRRGVPLSLEHRAKLSAAGRGRKLRPRSPEHKANAAAASAARRGVKLPPRSPEHSAAIAAGLRARAARLAFSVAAQP